MDSFPPQQAGYKDNSRTNGWFSLGVIAGFLGYSGLYLFLAGFILLTGIYYKWLSSKAGDSKGS